MTTRVVVVQTAEPWEPERQRVVVTMMRRRLAWLWSPRAATLIVLTAGALVWSITPVLAELALAALEPRTYRLGLVQLLAGLAAATLAAGLAFATTVGLRHRRRLLAIVILTSPPVVLPAYWAGHAAIQFADGTAFIERESGVGVPYEGDYRGIGPTTRIPIRDHKSNCAGLPALTIFEYQIHNAVLAALHTTTGPMPGAYRGPLPPRHVWRHRTARSKTTARHKAGAPIERLAYTGRLRAHRTCYRHDRIVCRIEVFERATGHSLGLFGYDAAPIDRAERDVFNVPR